MEKNNKTLNVPHLRFPEFSGEWEIVRLGDVCKFFSGGTPSSTNKDFYDGDIPFIRSGEIHSNSTELYITEAGLNRSSAKIVEQGDLLLALYGATSGDIAISKIKGAINQAILCIRTNHDNFFLKSCWEKHCEKLLQTYLQGGQGNLSAEIVKSIKMSFPSCLEQKKISGLLSLIEERISTQKKIIEKYESLIRGLITYVNKGEVWKCKATALRDVLTEVHEKNVENYEVCSVSVSQGVINQIDYLGRSFAAKEVLHYNVVHYGDLVYTKSPTGEFPYGIVKRSNLVRPVAVSPLYGVYRPVNDTIGIYLHLYFKSPVYTKNYLHSLIQKGAKNTINITNQHFLNNKIQIPEPDVLEVFVHAASEIEKKILAENRALASFEKQKNYLLSKMFI